MTTTVFNFEVAGEDCHVQLRADNDVFDLMKILCDSWLDRARCGDGGVYDHLWRLTGPNGTKYEGLFDMNGQESSSMRKKMSELNLKTGDQIRGEYDYGSTTYFKLNVTDITTVSDDVAQQCPRQLSQAPNLSLPVHEYPAGTPTLDELFPKANALLFDPIVQWVGLFPCSETVAAFVEAGPNAMGDLVFAPHKFSSVTELLLSLEAAGQVQPDAWCRKDALSRFVFPATQMSKAYEKDYAEFKTDLDEFEERCERAGANSGPMGLDQMAGAGLSEDDVFRMCGAKQAIVRLSEKELNEGLSELRNKGFDFDKLFPKTCAAHNSDDYMWISYRRGVLSLCKGHDSGERGVPSPGGVLAKSICDISSLHGLFCAVESMWP